MKIESNISERTYTAIFECAEEGGYVVHIPALNDLVTEGDTLEEAIAMAEDAIRGYIECLIEDDCPIPEEKEQARPFIRDLVVTLR